MTYQLIYASASTTPMQADDLEEILAQARGSNATEGISGALVYADGTFLQILEGDNARVRGLMAKISKDVRHENVRVLREGDVPNANFSSWKMAYVGATAQQVAKWAGIDAAIGPEASGDEDTEGQRTAQFARDILALLESERPRDSAATPDRIPN